jgi:hypothetical protein
MGRAGCGQPTWLRVSTRGDFLNAHRRSGWARACCRLWRGRRRVRGWQRRESRLRRGSRFRSRRSRRRLGRGTRRLGSRWWRRLRDRRGRTSDGRMGGRRWRYDGRRRSGAVHAGGGERLDGDGRLELEHRFILGNGGLEGRRLGGCRLILLRGRSRPRPNHLTSDRDAPALQDEEILRPRRPVPRCVRIDGHQARQAVYPQNDHQPEHSSAAGD